MHPTSPMRNLIALLRREWYWMLFAVLCVCGVLVINMRTNTAADYAVLSYEPRTVSTLAAISHMQQQSGWLPHTLTPTDLLITIPEPLQSAHGALAVLWVTSRVLPSVFLIVLINYLIAAAATTLTAYVALRIASCVPRWAWLGSVAFGLMPARFWWPDLMAQWFVVVPLIAACIAALWYRPQLWAWRQWVWYDWLVIVGIVVAATAFGKSAAYMASLAIGVVVIMYRHETLRWQPALPLLVMGGLIWLVPTFLVWSMSTAQAPFPYAFRGISLAALILPHAHHVVPAFATIGNRYMALQIDHTNTFYMGVLAVTGLGILVWRGIVQLVATPPAVLPQRVTAFVLIMLLVAHHIGIGIVLVWLYVFPFTQWEQASIWIVFWSLQTAIHVVQHVMVRWRRAQIGVMVACAIVVGIDQVPQTTFLQQLPRAVMPVASSNWRQGIFLTQATLPADVVAVRGFAEIIPGYGRWAAPDATVLEIQMGAPMQTPLVVHIRAKTDPDHVGIQVPVQIGTERQMMTLTTDVREYMLRFTQPTNATQLVIHLPPTTSTDVSRGVVFVQSLWAQEP